MTDILLSMLNDLSLYKGKSRDELLYKYIKDRLDKSYQSYIKELNTSTSYLERRREHRVLKKMNIYDKQSNN
jgi:hypothetical protein